MQNINIPSTYIVMHFDFKRYQWLLDLMACFVIL
uniref:Uncharacterized protein n=1 Tax=Anguilla anguilla TaxID=7936 RepID=A0A0E9SLU2_ANGAN